jgi:hypothetical protein
MATRDTYSMSDLFAWEPLTAPSSIFPLHAELQPRTSPVAPPHALDALVPFGCEPQRTAAAERA